MTGDEAVFLDANVPMYAAGADPLLRAQALGAVRHLVEREVPIVTSAEVLQEILHRYFSIGRATTGLAVYRFTVEVASTVLPVRERDTARALELLLATGNLPARDALHAAVMEHAGVKTILSKDRQFDSLPSVHRVDPADLAEAR